MNNDIKYTGNVLCKGTGLKVYFQMPLTRRVDGITETKVFTYEAGTLQQILAEINRQSSWNYVAGRKNPVGVNKGLRNSYGTITFTQLDAGIINAMLEDVKKWNSERTGLIDASLEGFSFENFSFNEPDAALIVGATENLNIKIYENEVVQLDDLPPIDIIVIGTSDNIDPSNGIFELNEQYIFKCLKTTFLSETFGITAGAPLHNVATKCLFLGGVEPWRKVEEADGIR